MPHVSDGDIHAFLDGALELFTPSESEQIRTHLTDCPDCAARLEDERELRSRTDAILAGSGPPAQDIPPFEEIRARATATGVPRTRARRGVPPALAWAASLILALGTGWAARGAYRASPELQPTRAPTEVVRSVASADPEERETPVRTADVSEAVGAVTESNELDQVGGQTVGRGSAVAAAPPPAEPSLGEADAVTLDDARAEAALASRIDPHNRVSVDAREDEDLPASLAMAEEQENPSLGGERRARQANQPLVLPVGGGTIMVPGLEVRSVEFDASSSLGGVRIVQVLPGGETLELLYLRSGGGSEDAARADAQDREGVEVGWQDELPSGWSSAVLERSGGWLFARSPVSPDSLNALMGSLR